jgi:hypothetical protein
VFVVLVPRVEHLAAHSAAVLEAVGKVYRLNVVLYIMLGAVLEAGANGAQPGRGTFPLHSRDVLIEGVQARPFTVRK